MPTPLRYIPPDHLWKDAKGRPTTVVEITIRTTQGRFLLKPTPKHTSRILGVLGRAQKNLDFELYAYSVLSNHMLLNVGVRDAKHQAAIMEFVNGNVARELGRRELSDWSGPFWSRRGRPIPVLDEADMVARLRYCLANGVKENLVSRCDRWPGAHAAGPLSTGKPVMGTWIDRTELGEKRRKARGKLVDESECAIVYPVTLSKLPCWRDDTDAKYQARIKEMCREIEEAAAAERERTGATVLGPKRVLRYAPHHRPDHLGTSPAPKVHARDSAKRHAFIEALRTFTDAYRAAVKALREGLKTLAFPEGGIPPTVRWGAPG